MQKNSLTNRCLANSKHQFKKLKTFTEIPYDMLPYNIALQFGSSKKLSHDPPYEHAVHNTTIYLVNCTALLNKTRMVAQRYVTVSTNITEVVGIRVH